MVPLETSAPPTSPCLNTSRGLHGNGDMSFRRPCFVSVLFCITLEVVFRTADEVVVVSCVASSFRSFVHDANDVAAPLAEGLALPCK